MASSSVKTVQYVDPRIEPQPDPVYDYIIGPTQNQYYKIGASGLSDSSLTFNNLTTLGIDRAYLDTFELELDVTFTFTLGCKEGTPDVGVMCPAPSDWTFQSFPFNTVCDEARVNINGGAFFSQPMCYVRAKERYMNQETLSHCYENVCPIHRPILQTESGRTYRTAETAEQARSDHDYTYNALSTAALAGDPAALSTTKLFGGVPTRYGRGVLGMLQSQVGVDGGFNNSIVRLGGKIEEGGKQIGWVNYKRVDATHTEIRVVWREPLFVSPFSSRYDATYGRPLYNITSMDFAFNMMDLGNMIRLSNYNNMSSNTAPFVSSYSAKINSAKLCYQVMTIPSILQKPLTTLVPYRRFVPYITEYNTSAGSGSSGDPISPDGTDKIEVLSGVYTMNEIPTAIWVFLAPTKDLVQTNNASSFVSAGADNVCSKGNYDHNKLFGYLTHINISMANTTQILNTAEIPDLYRIAKANGCQDSYWSWAGIDTCDPSPRTMISDGATKAFPLPMYYGAGSVLRLRPGVDLIVPDIPLIPGANANNMVFQVRANFSVPPHPAAYNKYALWLLFEYVGVAAISPGQCEITMNPLGSGEIVAMSPVMSATSHYTEGALEGSGFWDNVRKSARIAAQVANTGVISRILRNIPGMESAAKWAEEHGFGAPAAKRGRSGGAVIGKGLNDWV